MKKTEITCPSCYAVLDTSKAVYKTADKGQVKCGCGKCVKITRSYRPKGFIRDEKGTLYRAVEKQRMSKKERIKKRKAEANNGE